MWWLGSLTEGGADSDIGVFWTRKKAGEGGAAVTLPRFLMMKTAVECCERCEKLRRVGFAQLVRLVGTAASLVLDYSPVECQVDCKVCERGTCQDRKCRTPACDRRDHCEPGIVCVDCRLKGFPANIWANEYRACFACQQASEHCVRQKVVTAVSDGEYYKVLKLLRAQFPDLGLFVDNPHGARNHFNTCALWLLKRHGHRFGAILLMILRCGRDAWAMAIIMLTSEAALVGRDGNHMRNKMVVMGAKVCAVLLHVGPVLGQLYPVKYLQYKDKKKIRVDRPAFITVARNSNIFVTTDTEIWRFVQEMPMEPQKLTEHALVYPAAWIKVCSIAEIDLNMCIM